MHTSGLVIAVGDEPAAALDLLARLSDDVRLTFGVCGEREVAAVLECGDAATAEAWHRAAVESPGIRGVEVVFVHWDDVRERANDGGN